ncbi:hypothetical protein LOK74_10255 [Brevibacillus humidisoli]|uniref:hypothetical protein n=1 Tax=Brevibacillus humidisoli TaxID=2895522 RepID=UPI001E315825|nr:hypothetical protein [Brevibacillus humidisoli]UFJ42842.1 hypothetical protein LOK74_10255 [Brevibacillus humidisoli]
MVMLATVGCQQQDKTVQEEENKWKQVAIDEEEIQQLQHEVDNGHVPDWLDPHYVAKLFVSKQLDVKDPTLQEVETEANDQKLFRTTLQDGSTVEISLIQPVKKDSTGIWAVQQYRVTKKDQPIAD